MATNKLNVIKNHSNYSQHFIGCGHFFQSKQFLLALFRIISCLTFLKNILVGRKVYDSFQN